MYWGSSYLSGPQDKKALHQLFGLMIYYQRFVPSCVYIDDLYTMPWLPTVLQEGGGGEGYKRDHTIFRRKKGGISRNWEPQRGYHWTLWKDSEGGPLKFAWKLSHGGITKVIKSYKGGSLQWSKIQRGEKLNFTLFSPKSPAPSLSPPPPPHHAINNDRSLKARELARDPDVLISVSYRSPRLPPASTTFLSQTVRS